MEKRDKKILLKQLVDSGTNIRREFIPSAIVQFGGKYPVGEFWDANKTLDMIVNGAHETHDTVRELDEFAHNTEDKLTAEISRAKAAEQALDDKIENRYTKSEIDTKISQLTSQIQALQALCDSLQQQIDELTPSNQEP